MLSGQEPETTVVVIFHNDLKRLRASYGIDAPGLVRTFFLISAAALALAEAVRHFMQPGGISIALSIAGWAVSIYALFMGCFMLDGSLLGKVRDRNRLLDLVPWSGNEIVLDVGCCRGLLLTAATQRVPDGSAVGIDLWLARDQSGNRPQATLANARREKVTERVTVLTGDVRLLPFEDGSFDVVTSHWVIHNLNHRMDRALALTEMARVLKPDGWLLLADIGNHAEDVSCLRDMGFVDVRHVGSHVWDRVRAIVTFGSFWPGTVLGQRPSEPAAAMAEPPPATL